MFTAKQREGKLSSERERERMRLREREKEDGAKALQQYLLKAVSKVFLSVN